MHEINIIFLENKYRRWIFLVLTKINKNDLALLQIEEFLLYFKKFYKI